MVGRPLSLLTPGRYCLLQAIGYPDDFDLREYAMRAFGSNQHEAENGKMIWKFSQQATNRAAQFQFHPSQRIVSLHDGSGICTHGATALKSSGATVSREWSIRIAAPILPPYRDGRVPSHLAIFPPTSWTESAGNSA